MAIRVIASEVLEILDDNCDVAESKITPFILAASTIIDKVFSIGETLSEDTLKEIERWYTAHLIASTIARSAETETLGDASVKYTGFFSMGLDLTPYGQIVKQLDTTGKLALNGKKVASIYAVKSFDE
jgi:hypothetical protein